VYKEEALLLGEDFQNFACKGIPEDFFEESDDCRWATPYIVNTAFACELYLKSFASDGESAVRGHRWNEIFENLADEKKTLILNHPNLKDDDEFYEKLEEGGKLFETWRYSFEKGKSRSVEFVFLDTFTEVMHDLAKGDLLKLKKS